MLLLLLETGCENERLIAEDLLTGPISVDLWDSQNGFADWIFKLQAASSSDGTVDNRFV